MPKIARVKLRWSGLNGSPGYSVFHFRDFVGPDPTLPDAQAAVDKVDAFAGIIRSLLLPGISLQTMADVDVLDEQTGVLETTLNASPDPAVTGAAAAGTMAGGAGAVITWRSTAVRNGRRLRGRTFIVPIASSQYEANGTLAAGALTNLNNAAAGLTNVAGGADLGIWGRPSAPGASDGMWAAVTGHSVPDMAAVLRSRRD